jgi:NTP pyrophosphatase (non-canonical NTP hydrolase)
MEARGRSSIKDLQEYVAWATHLRGFDRESLPEKFMLLLEECGEFARAIRKASNIKTDEKSDRHHPDLEAADILFYLLDICNKQNINLERAFWEKEEINKKRVWK